MPTPPKRRFRFPGRKPIDYCKILTAILFVLKTGMTWDDLPAELGCGCALLGKLAALGWSVPVPLVLDNARYQRCALVIGAAKKLGIELLFLPTYSPNLNLIERLWKFVKKEVLNRRLLGGRDSFRWSASWVTEPLTYDLD